MELENGLLSDFNESHRQIWDSGSLNSESLSNKRKRNETGHDQSCGTNVTGGQRSLLHQESVKKPRHFILIDGNKGVYYSECWEPNGSTLYLPVSGSLLANMEKYDQISFEQGFFFIGDTSGGFQQKAQGQAMHCWRYSEQEKKLFIALSYFFTSYHVFQDVVNSLGGL